MTAVCGRHFTDQEGRQALCTRPIDHNEARQPKQWGHKGEPLPACRHVRSFPGGAT